MKVSELILRLQQMPPEVEAVCAFDDGFGTEQINHVWLSKAGRVVLTSDEWVGRDDHRPQEIPKP